jgi:hypothetical protein
MQARSRQRENAHEEETRPLHANLCDSKQCGCAGEAANLPAAGHVGGALGQGQDVGDARSARHGAEQDEQRTQAARGASLDDLVVLREVRDEDADDEEAPRRLALRCR